MFLSTLRAPLTDNCPRRSTAYACRCGESEEKSVKSVQRTLAHLSLKRYTVPQYRHDLAGTDFNVRLGKTEELLAY